LSTMRSTLSTPSPPPTTDHLSPITWAIGAYGRVAGVGRGDPVGVGGGVRRDVRVRRPTDVGDGLGVGEHLPLHGVGVGVGVGVAVAVGVAVTVAVAVAVGVGVRVAVGVAVAVGVGVGVGLGAPAQYL